MRQPLIKQLERDDLSKVYTRAAEYPSISTKLIKDLINTDYFYDLTYGHVKYLESRLVEIARQIGSMPLENGNTPPRSSLSEAAQANMESFLETLGIVLPAIRVDMFLNKARSVPKAATIVATPAEPAEEKFILQTPKHDLYAEAILRDGEWVVQAGARARGSWVGSNDVKTHYGKLHSDLVENGILIFKNGFSVF